jgi:hypothetical protein
MQSESFPSAFAAPIETSTTKRQRVSDDNTQVDDERIDDSATNDSDKTTSVTTLRAQADALTRPALCRRLGIPLETVGLTPDDE